MRTLKAGVLYFALVFGAGFVLGTVRTLWVTPRLGERTAELIEAPFMFVVTVLAARWVVQRLSLPVKPSLRFAVGCIALGLLLAAEVAVVTLVRGLTIQENVAARDPVAGIVYLVMLAVFAVMPMLVARRPGSE